MPIYSNDNPSKSQALSSPSIFRPPTQAQPSSQVTYSTITSSVPDPALSRSANISYNNLAPQQQTQPQPFSWLDLDATWNFATQNGGTTEQEIDDIMTMEGGFETSPYEAVGYMPDIGVNFLDGGSEGLPF